MVLEYFPIDGCLTSFRLIFDIKSGQYMTTGTLKERPVAVDYTLQTASSFEDPLPELLHIGIA